MIAMAPALLVVVVLFGAGLGLAVGESLPSANYLAVLQDPEFRVSLGFTMAVAAAATGLSVVSGFLLAVGLRGSVSRWRTVSALLQAPMAIPHLVLGLVLLQLLTPSGLVARILYALGLVGSPGDFPALLNDAYGFGIVLAYWLKETPFVAVMTLAVLLRVGPEYEALAQTLGASGWQRLRYVTLPLAMPALVGSSVLVFAYLFSAFEVPFLLGRPYPAMLAVIAERRFVSPDLAERPGAMAIAVTMSAITALLVGVYLRVAKEWERGLW